MMLPADPVADFIVGQARFGLHALQTFFDALLGLRGASEFGQRSLGAGV